MKKPKARRLYDPTKEYLGAARVAATPDAPADERAEAVAAAARELAPMAKAVPVNEVMRWAQAFAPKEIPGQKLQRMARVSLDLEDPNARTVWLVRPVGLDWPQLRSIVREDPVLKSVIWTRISQVQRFLRPSLQEWKPGYRIRFRDRHRKTTPEDRARISWLEQYVLNAGAEFDPRKRRALRRDNLWDWTSKHLQDSLTLDAAPVELIPTPSGRTHGWVHVDGGMVYLVDPNYGATDREPPSLHQRYGLDIPDPTEVVAILAHEGRVQAWYTHDDLLYRVRRPRSEALALGYGQPEPEDLIRIVTGFVNALTLNLRGFTHNSIPKGVLTVWGDFNEQDIEQFRMEWDAYVTGLSNRWRMPVMISSDAQNAGVSFVPIGQDFNEMYFARWMTFLVAIKAALYGMDPEEINFESFSARPSTLSGSDTEERLASSKDKGLWPLLQFLGQTLNEILYTVDPEVELYWTGLEQDQQLAKADEEKMLTLGEFRRSRGESEPESPILANAPMNPALLSVYQLALQQEQQEQAQAQGVPPEPQGGEVPPGAEQEGMPPAEEEGEGAPPEGAGGEEGPASPDEEEWALEHHVPRAPGRGDEDLAAKAVSVTAIEDWPEEVE